MLCKCCYTEVPYGKAKCIVCGCILLFAGDKQTDEADILVQVHRERKLKSVSVSLKTYDYLCENGEVSLVSSDFVKLADALDLEYEKIKWFDGYEPLESGRSFSITIGVNNGGEQREVVLSMTPTEPIEHSSLGLVLESGFMVRLVVGSEQSKLYSEPISLVETL